MYREFDFSEVSYLSCSISFSLGMLFQRLTRVSMSFRVPFAKIA
jgi:hypothetical protein